MSGVDSRIVSMKFDNAAFEQGVGTTLGTLGKLKAALKFSNGSQGLNDIQAAANRFSLGPVEGAVTGVSKKFIALSTIAITALSSIVTKAISSGTQLLKALSIAPIMDGFHEYETNMDSIQTVLANTQAQGATLDDVNAALNQLNLYSDKTIYNFSQMAKNIGTFTAAGVDLKTSVASIKGIANLAAISGSNADQASMAMYQLSQAIASGRVSLQDWNSVVNAGMGGATFQKALANTAEAMGKLKNGAVKTVGPMKQLTVNGKSFRESISGGDTWLTSEILTNTLKQFSGDLTDAQLKAQGFNAEQIKAIQQTAKMGVDAATKVKTLSQLMDTLKEAVGSGWTQSFQLIFGNFDEAKNLFTSVSNTLGGIVGASANARNKVLGDWNNLGGRDVLIKAVGNAFKALEAVIKPIKDALHDIFPPATGKSLYNLTVALQKFTEHLIIGQKTADNLKRTFRGVFAVFDILGQAVKGLFGVIKQLFGAVSSGNGSFLNFTGNIGDFLVHLDEAIKQGGYFTQFFSKLGDVLTVPIKLLKAVGSFIHDIFAGFDNSKAQTLDKALAGIHDRLSPLAALGEHVREAFSGLSTVFDKIGKALQPLGQAVGQALSKVKDALANAFSGANFSQILDAINTGLFAGLILLVKKFLNKGIKVDINNGMFDSIKEGFESLTGSMKAMQTQIKAKSLLMIAGAVALLTASIIALSLIDSDKLTKALTAVGIAFGQLLGSMAILSKITGSAGYVKIPLIAGSMILLSTSVLILTGAVKNLAGLSWQELAKGLVGVTALLTELSLASIPLSKNSGGMISAGIGITAIAVAMKILASAVKDFGNMDWKVIGKGLASVAASLLIIGAAMRLMPTGMVLQAAALVIIGGALKVLASAVQDFGKIDMKVVGKGLLDIAGALVVIGLAMHLMPIDLPITAAGLVIVGAALLILAKALKAMGDFSWEEIGKGLVTLAGALAILAAGLYVMTGTLAGSAALLVAAAALAILAPVLVVLGSLSWEAIAKGMVVLAGAFTVLGLAGLVLSPLVPAIMGLSVALLAVGAGLALAGVGALAFATAFTLVAAAGTAGVAVLGAMLATIINAIPGALAAFGMGVVAFIGIIATAGPEFVAAFTTILSSLLTAVINVTPQIGAALLVLINTALNVLVQAIPKMVDAGLKILLGVLQGISNNIGKIVNVVGDIIARFLEALGEQIPKITQAGVDLLLDFIDGLSQAIDDNSERIGAAAGKLGVAIAEGIAKGIMGAAGSVISAAKNVGKSALKAAAGFLGINSPSKLFRDEIGQAIPEGIAVGIDKYSGYVTDSAKGLAKTSITTMKDTMARVSNVLNSDIDMNPVITPVLDLSLVKKNTGSLNSMVNPKVMAAQVSYGQAASISSDTQAVRTASIAAASEPVAPVVKFEQNNYSPKALSAVEIYRQTKNQLSLAKEALATS